MKDPFFIQPIPWLQRATEPVAEFFGLTTLPYHIHEVLAGALLYGFIYYPLAPFLSRLFIPRTYAQLPRKRRISWDVHIVSFVQSSLINILALWVMWTDEERKAMTWEERVWGYTGGCGMIQGLAAGYFLWDLIVTVRNMDIFTIGTLAHAISALLVYSLGFRPFVNFYACNFILWELSTPFLNIHWFLDKLGKTGSNLQLYNGLILITTFFSCRIVYGSYQSFLVLQDIRQSLGKSPSLSQLASQGSEFGTMRFATETSTVPTWLALAYLVSNLTLNSLNSYWFFKMIQALYKRFQPSTEVPLPEKPVLAETSALDSTASSGLKSRAAPAVDRESELDIVN
ncbi:related to DUF887 domain protein [Cephalotrichum gorgonifer]|uniref:Related to DUF887 domain protein n=1 Tax=Cephalotrichum gorgonifer TaxID=2041049 RepID=A0AAE8MRP6_9PEZI|nr:related to DUF887 domain protein [Cephalotrichum gorgonifer]